MIATLTSETPTVADVLRAVAYAMPALEIVGGRITNWDIEIVDTVADNASSGLFVLGGPVRSLEGLDLRALQMQMMRRKRWFRRERAPHVSVIRSTRWRGWPANWLTANVRSRRRHHPLWCPWDHGCSEFRRCRRGERGGLGDGLGAVHLANRTGASALS